MFISYVKMHGTGNRILLVDQRHNNLSPPGARRLAQLGTIESVPGFDQLMWIGPAGNNKAIASYRVFNNDGTEVEQCGNGVRCVARFLHGDRQGDSEFLLSSPSGPVAARVFADGQVAVSMGEPEFVPARIPFVAEQTADFYSLRVEDEEFEINAVSMGNPHCVLSVDDVSTAAVADLGAKIEHHARFPALTNVGFRHIVDRQTIDLRVHERGVGETAACGTAACAAVVSSQSYGALDEEVAVRLPGGQVVVSWRGKGTEAWLTGNAEWIEEGSIEL